MGFPTPEDNLNNYMRSSTLDKVKYLNGKEFLVMFGTADGLCLFFTPVVSKGSHLRYTRVSLLEYYSLNSVLYNFL